MPVTRWYALDVRSAATPFNPFDAGAPATTGITIRIVPATDQPLQSQLINTNAASSASRLTAPLQPGATFSDARTTSRSRRGRPAAGRSAST